MQEKQEKNEYLWALSAIPRQKESLIKSQFHEQYLNKITPNNTDSYHQTSLRFADRGICHNQHEKYKEFTYDVKHHTINGQIVNLQVKIGKFELEISVISISSSCPLIKEDPYKKGGCGMVYLRNFADQTMAIKCVSISSETHRQVFLDKIIKQLALMKICEVLQACPLMKKYLGFDLIVYEDFAIFAMEQCYSPRQIEQISKTLSLMHTFNIVHMDIKPQNIVYSPFFQKAVFVDFGFSEILQELCGYKTLSSFRGTLNFCGPEMFDLFSLEIHSKYVDLYYNDLASLEKTTKEHQLSKRDKNKIHERIQQSTQIIPQLQSDFYAILFKASIINQDYFLSKFMLNIKNRYLIHRQSSSIIVFFKNLLPNKLPSLFIKQQPKQFMLIDGYKEFKQRRSNPILLSFKNYDCSRDDRYQQIKKNNLHKIKYKSPIQNLRFLSGEQKWLYSKDIFMNNQEQCLAELLQSLRFDKKNVDYNHKLTIAKQFQKNLLSSHQQEKQISSSNQIKQIRIVFEYIADFCFRLPHTPWKLSKIYVIIYQMLLLNASVKKYLMELFKFANQYYIKCSQKILMFGWMQKYQQIMLKKYKVYSNDDDLPSIQLCQNYSQILMQQIINKFIDSDNVEESSISKILTKLKQLKKQAKSTFNITHINHLQIYLNTITDEEIKIFLKYQLYDTFAQFFSNSKQSRQFAKIYEKMASLILKQKYNQSNNYFHILIQSYFKYQVVLIKDEGGSVLNQIQSIINCNEVFMGLKLFYSRYFYINELQLNLFFPFLKSMSSKLFQSHLSRYLIRQFIEVMSRIHFYRSSQTASVQDQKTIFKELANIIRNYVSWRKQYCKSIKSINFSQMILYFVCFQQVSNFSGFNSEIERIMDQHLRYIQKELNYPQFNEEQTRRYIQKQQPYLLLMYIQLLIIKITQTSKSNVVLAMSFDKVLFFIALQKQWHFFMQLMLNSIIQQKVKNKYRCNDQLQQMMSISQKYQSFAFYLQPSVYLIFHTLQLYARTNQIIKMKKFLSLISQEISHNSIFRYINTFITNLGNFFKRNSKLINFDVMNFQQTKIQWKNRYLIVYSLMILKQQKETNLYAMAREILKFIQKVNNQVRQGVLSPFYRMMLKLSQSNRKQTWITIRKGRNIYRQVQAKTQFKKRQILIKLKRSSTSSMQFLFKKLLNHKLQTKICQFVD